MEQALSERFELIFAHAAELSDSDRAAYLELECTGDDALRREVESLLPFVAASAARFAEPACKRYAVALAGEEPADRLAIGQQLGDYRITGLLGRGGMGEVYRAWHAKLKREVALKVLPRALAADAQSVRRFQQEAHAASALNHPNILTVYDVGQFELDDGGALSYIACELIEGKTLRARIEEAKEQGRKLAWPEVVAITMQIAEALAVAHAAGIIHRDIKPDNVMLRESDGDVKVLDFGIAKLEERPGEEERRGKQEVSDALGATALANSQTLTGLLGTPDYLSPEQARRERVDARADIFAFGVVLHEMLAGRHPLDGLSAAERREELLRDRELPGLGAVARTLPAALVALVARATRKRREERYTSAGEMLDVLRALRPARQQQHPELAARLKANRQLNQAVTLSAMDRRVRLSLTEMWRILWHSDIERGPLESALLRRSFWAIAGKGAALVLFTFVVVFAVSKNESWDETTLRDGSTAGVRRAVFINGGKRLVAVGEDHKIRVWDFKTRQLERELSDHQGSVVAVAASPDDNYFATASWDGTVKVWDARELNVIKTLTGHRGQVSGVAFSPDGRYLASAAITQYTTHDAILWRVGDWEKVRELPLYGGDWVWLFFAPNDPRQLFGGSYACDVTTGQEINLTVHPNGSNAAFGPDGSRFVYVDSGGDVIFGDLARQTASAPIAAHRDNGRGAAFSPDGKVAATGSEDIVLWNAETRELITRWECPSYVWSLVWSPDGKYLISTHGNGSILIWDVAGRECIGDFNQHSRAVTAVAFAPDKQHVASGGEDRSVIVWDMAHQRKEAILFGHMSRISVVAYVPNSSLLAALDQSGLLICWDLATKQERWRRRDTGAMHGLAVSPNGRFIAHGPSIVASTTGQLVNRYGGVPVMNTWDGLLALSGDGRRLAALGMRQLYLFNTGTWELLAQHATDADTAICFSPDGRRVATGNINGRIEVWQTEPLRQLERPSKHEGRVKQVVFAPDGRRIVSVGDDKKVRLWDAETGELLRELGAHPAGVLAVAFSVDGEQIATGGHDKSVRVYTRHTTWLGGWRWEESWVQRATDGARRWFASWV